MEFNIYTYNTILIETVIIPNIEKTKALTTGYFKQSGNGNSKPK